MGALDSREQHQNFMLDIGRVVADYCGGTANWINEQDFEDNYLSDDTRSPMLSVSPNDSLPSLNRNVWALFDTSGWEGEEVDGIEIGEPMSQKEISDLKMKLQALLIGDNFKIPFKLKEKAFNGDSTAGTIISDEQGIYFQLDGYSDCSSDDNKGFPLYVEKYEEEVNLVVHANINIEDTTHFIPLAHARNENRLPTE